MKKDGTITNRNLYIYVEGYNGKITPTPSDVECMYVVGKICLCQVKRAAGVRGNVGSWDNNYRVKKINGLLPRKRDLQVSLY